METDFFQTVSSDNMTEKLAGGFQETSGGFFQGEPNARLSLADVQKLFQLFWKTGYGSIAADEALFVQELITKHRPAHFLEIGMASGLSGGLISRFLDASGGKKFTSIDHDNVFFGDKSKSNGFLIQEIYTGTKVEVVKRPYRTALDLDEIGESFDMAFIDANHQHPWPLIDTLCLYPHLTGSKIVVHHDLRLFRKQDIVFGIGPKYLFDQFPSSHRIASTANDGNIFAIDLNMTKAELEKIAMDGFSLPWSLRTPLQENYVNSVRAMLKRHYSQSLCEVFESSLKKFNVLDRFRSGL